MKTTAATPSSRKHTRTIALGTISGSLIEWYDFYIFGTAAALVFGDLFFPSFSPLAGTLLAFATFATAWIVRPLGGIVFGILGDRLGRRTVLLITVVGMGVATAIIGVLPTYESVGVWAPIILVIIRILQGLFAGGEWSGASILAVESAPPGRRGLFGSFPQAGIPLALALAQTLFLISFVLPEGALQSYGWRIPFLASIAVLAVGYYFRRRISETPTFEKARAERNLSRAPLAQVFRTAKRPLFTVFFGIAGMNVAFLTFSTFALSYATDSIGFSEQHVLVAIIIAASLDTVGTIICGALSDRVGRRRMYAGGMIAFAVGFFPFFYLINQGSTGLLIIAFAVFFGLCHPFSWSVASSFFTELFPTSTRYTGSSLGYQVGGVLFGAPAPIIGTALVAANDGAPWAYCGFAALLALISTAAVLLAPETAHEQLREDTPRSDTLDTAQA